MRQFLEYAVACDDILESLNFYRALGFAEYTTSDALPYPYAVVGSGSFSLGLHVCDEPLPAIRFTSSNVQKIVMDWSEHGTEFEAIHLDIEELHRASILGPSRNRLSFIEARTFSLPPEPTHCVLGEFTELALAVRDILEAAHFWAPYSDHVVSQQESPPYMQLALGDLHLGLTTQGINEPTVSFLHPSPQTLDAHCQNQGIDCQHIRGPNNEAGVGLRAPEGTAIQVFEKPTGDG